jgi:glycine/D-amino acid oxidase-like deaminating enzyme
VPGEVAVHDAHGWWIAEAAAAGLVPAPLPPLASDLSVDVLVVGGGYTGLWTAWHVLAAEPQARVAVLEADRCGFGPSGRNGGFVSSLGPSLPRLRGLIGRPAARTVGAAAQASVRAIGDWCAAEAVDAWFAPAPHLLVATCRAQDGIGLPAVDGDEVVPLGPDEVRAVCASPVFRGGIAVRTGATVQPARLAFGLCERLRARGARVFEHTRVRALREGGAGVVAESTTGAHVQAGAAVVAVNAAAAALAPLRARLTVSSSHLLITEPVPDVIADLGWTGGEPITDGRALLHYMRTTPDGRIAYGWAGGRMAAGARLGGRREIDRAVVAHAHRDLLRTFPALAGRRIDHAWGGPIDVAANHLPTIATLGARTWAAFGYTGNGVGPSHLLGRTLAALALGRRDDAARLPLVDPPSRPLPPEPLRLAGAALIRRALVRREDLAEAGRAADPATRALTALPALLGVHVVR